MHADRRSIARWWRLLQIATTAATLGMASAAIAGAQSVPRPMLAGTVVDSGTGIGVAGAEVAIEGTGLRTLTDERGAFRFTDGGVGARTLNLRRLGFRPLSVTVGADNGQAPIAIRLSPSVAYLAPVRVRAQRAKYSGRLAGYYERLERRTQGQFITREDLEREHPTQLTDMLQRNPGIRITRGRPSAQSVRLRGRDCRPLVWLDGAPMSAGDVDMDSFSPASLEGIELYLGASSAPARYQTARGQSECGTVLLWSRGPDTEPGRAAGGVRPEELEELIASLSVFTSDQVDVPATLDSTQPWNVPYPPSMRASGESGVVLAEFVVDTLGRVEPANFGIVSSTHAFFSAAVQESARGVRFQPAVRKGHRVRQLVRQPFEFRPAGESR